MRLAGSVGASLLLGAALPAHAQKAIGSVSTADAAVTNSYGALQPAGGRVTLVGDETVTARDHTAALMLARGGELRVCQTTGVHLSAAPDDSLLLGLDRGAIEIRMKARAGDVLMTPDLRFTMADAGELELDMRVSTNGDTCVDNRGHKAPVLKIVDAFGDASYELKSGQHVTFEHGSLREVVDKETVPCGCPPDEKKMSLADAALASGGSKATPQQQSATAANPFPAAVSEGLAQPSPVPAEAPGQTHVQVASTLAYDPNAPKTADTAAAQEQAPAPQPVAAKKSSGGPFAAVGRFFKRLFVR